MTDNAKNNAKGTAAPAESLVGRIKQNPKMKWLTLGIAAAVVAVAGYMLYGKFVKGPAEEKAQIQLNEGMQLMQQGISQYQMVAQLDATPDSVLLPTLKTQGVINDSVPADSIPVLIKQYRDTQKQSVTIAFDQALKGQQTFPGLIKLAKGSGAPANAATYLAGICYYYMDNYKEAINALEDFSPKSDESISPMVLYALANCYACDNQLDKAVDTFKKAADKADNEAISPVCLIEAAKLLESQNKKDEAHALYEQVQTDYPQFGSNQNGMNGGMIMPTEIEKYLERTK